MMTYLSFQIKRENLLNQIGKGGISSIEKYQRLIDLLRIYNMNLDDKVNKNAARVSFSTLPGLGPAAYEVLVK